jgi:hypothetical protein
MRAWEIAAFVTAGVTFLLGAALDRADPAEDGHSVRDASVALDVLDRQFVQLRDAALVDIQQLLQELLVLISGGVVDAADPAVKATGSEEAGVDLRERAPSDASFTDDTSTQDPFQ